MTETGIPRWSLEDDCVAGIQGWGIFDIDSSGRLEIQRIDDMLVFCSEGDGKSIFVSDGDALAYVERQAADGSAFHQKALLIARRAR